MPYRVGLLEMHLPKTLTAAMKMDLSGAAPPITLYSFDARKPRVEGAGFLAKGSDADIGGYTTSEFTPVPHRNGATSTSTLSSDGPAENRLSPPNNFTGAIGDQAYMAFHGNMSLRVPKGMEGKLRPGYAGMRNKRRITLFGEDMWDLSSYSHLRVTVAYRGWEGWRNRWYCNVQTDGPILYVHSFSHTPTRRRH